MGGSDITSLALGALAAALPVCGAETSEPVQTLAIGVSLYNYSQVSPTDLEEARRMTSRVFRQAGIRIIWSEVPVSGEAELARRQIGRRLGVSDIRVRMLPESKVPRWAKNTHQVAFSLLPENGGFGTLASIYSARLFAIARRENRPPGLVLGCVIAHEMGHLLLPMKGHSRSGLMRFPVTGEYLSQASRGRLVFTAAQTKRLRQQLRERWACDKADSAPTNASRGRFRLNTRNSCPGVLGSPRWR